MTDIGYILGYQDEYEELRHSLRSLRFFPHRRVWIAGSPPPSWCVNVHYIPVEQESLDGKDHWAVRKTNQRRNLLALLDSSDVSDSFVFMNDDFMLVSPVGPALPPVPHLGRFTDTHRNPPIEKRKGPYVDLYHWLKDQGVVEPLHFPEHTPMVVDGRLADWMRQVWHITGFPVASLWGNMADYPTYKGPDFIVKRPEHEHGWPESHWAVSTVSRSFFDWPIGQKLRELHSEPSPYEGDQ